MGALLSYRVALALLLAFVGAQVPFPHAHGAIAAETAIEAHAGGAATFSAEHAADCLLCRTTTRTRAALPTHTVAAAPVAEPRLAAVGDAVHASPTPDLGAGPAPRAPPSISPFV